MVTRQKIKKLCRSHTFFFAPTLKDIEGYAYDELQWQCTDDSLSWDITVQCDSDMFLPILMQENGAADTRVAGTYHYHTDHLGSAHWITKGYEAVQFIHYMPYGEMWYNQQGSAYDERFKYTGKERDSETGYDYFGARSYMSDGPLWLSPDPLMDKYPHISPYAYCNWNPVNRIDPDGRDDEQRQMGIEKAVEFVKKNPNKSSTMYQWGAKGGPGEKVDCSGLVSHCIVAGEEDAPNKGNYNGVRNIANNSQKIEDINDLVAGNLVTFNTGGKYGDYSHIGIITDVVRDENGNVLDFQFIHSASSTGPTQNGYGDSYWRNRISGFYKWDTRPDVYKGPTLPQITIYGNKPNIMSPTCVFNIKPISININSYFKR